MRLAATVDYNKLPGGVEALTRLKTSHQKIKLDYTASVRYCTLYGFYSDVQAALTQLLGHPGGPELAENDLSRQAAPSSSRSQLSEDQSDRADKKREQKETGNSDKSLDRERSHSNKNPAPGGNNLEAIADGVGAALQPPAASAEDFSLIVDADMFQYLQKRCKKEYQQILSRYLVEVVNETNQGLTTLFLQVADPTRAEDGHERLKLARAAISQLYQENEAKICREQLPKFILRPKGGLRKAMDSLSARFPKILLIEDEQNVYFIGNTLDVSEAKRDLLLDLEERSDKKEDHARVDSPPPVEVESMDEEEDEKDYGVKAEGTSKYKLAARFKDSLLGGLGSRPPDFPFRPNSLPSRPPCNGPVLGHDVSPETTQISGGSVSRALNTGEDILFRTTPPAVTNYKPFFNTGTFETQLKTSTSPLSTTPSSFSESVSRPPVGSGSTLKRASSFSGTPQQRAQVVVPKSRDDSSKSTIRTPERSSNFSSQAVMGKQAEITVSKLIWEYIKEVYSAWVKNLTLEVQMIESSVVGIRDLTVLLKGADSSKVRRCQEHLENLIALVSADFSVKQLSWSELGGTDPEDETLKACCSEVKSRFKKIVIHLSEKGLNLAGQEEMCAQVAATLREVFSGEPEHHSLSSPSMCSSATSLRLNDPQSAHLNNSQLLLGTQTDKTDNQQWRTTYERDFGRTEGLNGSSSQPLVRRDHFVETTGAVKDDKQTETSIHLWATGKDTSPVNGDPSPDKNRDIKTERRNRRFQNSPDKSRSDQGAQAHRCVCGENRTSPVRSKCGILMCSKCLETRHAHCRVCTEAEQTPAGIRGEIKKSKLNMSLPGLKDGVIKIRYLIPDGIQGVSSLHLI